MAKLAALINTIQAFKTRNGNKTTASILTRPIYDGPGLNEQPIEVLPIPRYQYSLSSCLTKPGIHNDTRNMESHWGRSDNTQPNEQYIPFTTTVQYCSGQKVRQQATGSFSIDLITVACTIAASGTLFLVWAGVPRYKSSLAVLHSPAPHLRNFCKPPNPLAKFV